VRLRGRGRGIARLRFGSKSADADGRGRQNVRVRTSLIFKDDVIIDEFSALSLFDLRNSYKLRFDKMSPTFVTVVLLFGVALYNTDSIIVSISLSLSL